MVSTPVFSSLLALIVFLSLPEAPPESTGSEDREWSEQGETTHPWLQVWAQNGHSGAGHEVPPSFEEQRPISEYQKPCSSPAGRVYWGCRSSIGYHISLIT